MSCCKHMICQSGLECDLREKLDAAFGEIRRLNAVIVKEFLENDDLGTEFVYVSILKNHLAAANMALTRISESPWHAKTIADETLKLTLGEIP